MVLSVTTREFSRLSPQSGYTKFVHPGVRLLLPLGLYPDLTVRSEGFGLCQVVFF